VDLFELFGIELLSDKIEDRYGRRAAFYFALSAGVVLIGALVLLFVLLQR
jgi:MFS family permease